MQVWCPHSSNQWLLTETVSHVRSRQSEQNARHCNSRKYVQHMTGDRIGGTVHCGSGVDS